MILVETWHDVVPEDFNQRVCINGTGIDTVKCRVYWCKNSEWAIFTKNSVELVLLDQRVNDLQVAFFSNRVYDIILREEHGVDRVGNTVGCFNVGRFDVRNDAASVVNKRDFVVQLSDRQLVAVERVDHLVVREHVRHHLLRGDVVGQDVCKLFGVRQERVEVCLWHLCKRSVGRRKDGQPSVAGSLERRGEVGFANGGRERGEPVVAVREQRLHQVLRARGHRDAVRNQNSVDGVDDAVCGRNVCNHNLGR